MRGALGVQSGEPLSDLGQGGMPEKLGQELILMGEWDLTGHRELGEVS